MSFPFLHVPVLALGGPDVQGTTLRAAGTFARVEVWLALLGLLWAAWPSLRRVFGKGATREAKLLGALTAFGLVLRIALSPRTILHELYHAEFVDQQALFVGRPSLYGETGPAFYGVVAALTRAPAESVFFTNLVLATLTIPAVAAFDFALFRKWPRALFAGLVVAVLPLHLRFSASEDLSIPFTLFAALAWALAAQWTHDGSRRTLFAATCAVALAAQSRPESLAVPVLAVWLVAAQGGARRLLSKDLVFAALGLAVLCAGRLVALLGGMTNHRFPPEIRTGTPLAFVWWRPELTPVPVMLLALVGLYAAFRGPRRAVAAWVVGTTALYVAVSYFLLIDYPRYNFRSQVITTVPLALLCATGFAWLSERENRLKMKASAITTVLVVAVVGGALALAPAVRETGDQQEEFAFLRRAARALPPRGRLLAAKSSDNHLLGAFPRFVLTDAQKEYELLDLREGAWPAPGDDLFYYESMGCHVLPPSSGHAPLHPACEAVHERYRLEPLEVTEIRSPPYSSVEYLDRPWTVGFYRLRAKD